MRTLRVPATTLPSFCPAKPVPLISKFRTPASVCTVPVNSVMARADHHSLRTARSHILGQTDTAPMRNIQDQQQWFETYVEEVFLPCLTKQRDVVVHMYARLGKSYHYLVQWTAPTYGKFVYQNQTTLKVQAMVSGLLFLLSIVLKPLESTTIEMVPMLDEQLHQALYFGGDLTRAIAKEVARLILFTFEDHRDPRDDARYLLRHLHGERCWWDPGWVKKLSESGRFFGLSKWPQRLAGHLLCTRSRLARDSHLERYV